MTPAEQKEMNQQMKVNALRMADHHRKHCDGATCNISLFLLKKLVEQAGISLTDEEKSHFM